MKKRPITIHDIAKALNLSASSVSRALSDHPRISEKTKEKVRDFAKSHHYQQNTLASNLRKGKVYTIGLIVPRINRYFFADAIHGIESITNPEGYNLLICQSNESYEKEKENIKTLLNNRVCGILMSVSINTYDYKHIQPILDSQIPLVQFDRVVTLTPGSKVLNDNEKGAYIITKHLLAQGYKRIAYFAGYMNINIYKGRYKGYASALEEANIPLDRNLVFENVMTRDQGEEIANQMIASDNLPDAIFASSDYSALGAFAVLKKNGISIPGTIGMAGYSNEPFTGLIEPSLTTVDQKASIIGKTAAHQLLDEIKGTCKEPRTIIVESEIIYRESSNYKNNSV